MHCEFILTLSVVVIISSSWQQEEKKQALTYLVVVVSSRSHRITAEDTYYFSYFALLLFIGFTYYFIMKHSMYAVVCNCNRIHVMGQYVVVIVTIYYLVSQKERKQPQLCIEHKQKKQRRISLSAGQTGGSLAVIKVIEEIE